MKDIINPIVLRDTETGEVFTLEFSRESIRFAETRKFSISEVGDFPMTKIPDLFFYAFRKNHPNIPRSKTDKMFFDELGGFTTEQAQRLVQLYNVPMDALIKDEEEEPVKNAKVTVEM